MYKDLNKVEIAPTQEEGMTEAKKNAMRQFATTTDAKDAHEFIWKFNAAKLGYQIKDGWEADPILAEFEQDALKAKSLIAEKKELPAELSIFTGKFAAPKDIKE